MYRIVQFTYGSRGVVNQTQLMYNKALLYVMGDCKVAVAQVHIVQESLRAVQLSTIMEKKNHRNGLRD